MGQVIGSILPLALGVAISPLPIIATILMLLSPRAGATGRAFLLGWLVGIAVAVAVFILVGALLPTEQSGAARITSGIIKVVLGVLLLALAVRQWRRRPRPGEETPMPGWMSGIDTITPAKALGLAFLLAAVNPKNLTLAATAGIAISAGRQVGTQVLAGVVFLVIAGSTVAGPVLVNALWSQRMRPVLDALRSWLVTNNSGIMTVVLLILGATAVGNGLGALWL